MAPRLQQHYFDSIRPELGKELGIANLYAIPRIEKISINMGVGEAMQDKKFLELAADAMTEIAGQKPVLTLARQSIAGFKLREGVAIGCKVTLRRERMYEFLDRLVSIVLPEFATSGVLAERPLMATAITRWGCRNGWFSLS